MFKVEFDLSSKLNSVGVNAPLVSLWQFSHTFNLFTACRILSMQHLHWVTLRLLAMICIHVV